MDFEPVIGLEVHTQLKTSTKIFCSCANEFGLPPNTNVCPVCLGMPGTLPVLNKTVVDYAIRLGIAIQAEIAPKSVIARKNYFYPDLPKGYQISQYEQPIAERGSLTVHTSAGEKTIGITRIHIEEDAGKLVHDDYQPVSYCDMNRCGTPLIEIVSEPDIRTAEEAAAYVKEMRELIRYLDISDGNMEEGSLRCDANVSLRPVGQKEFGTRAEIKNMNSFRSVQRAIEFEIRRQRALLEAGEEVVQETRLYNADKNETFSMRGKEEAHDYRYFPDPDLIPIVIDQAWIETRTMDLPELPAAKRARFREELGLPEYDAEVLTASRKTADYFERAAQVSGNAKAASNWVMTNVLAELKNPDAELDDFNATAESLGELIKLIDQGDISGKIAKDVFEEMVASGQGPREIVEAKGLTQISDEGDLELIIDRIMEANPDNVERYRAGKKKLMGFFVGQVMKETKGQANPKLVNQILGKKLAG